MHAGRRLLANHGRGMVVLAAVACSGGALGQALPCSFELDLVYAPNCSPTTIGNAFGSCINEQGDLGGWFGCPGGNDHAFVAWNAAALTPLGGMPPGTYQWRAEDLAGDVVCGSLESTVLGSRFAFRWSNGVGVSLGTLAGGNTSEAYAINTQGVIVGAWGDVISGPFVFPRAFRWQNGVMQDLAPVLLPGDSRALDINDNGDHRIHGADGHAEQRSCLHLAERSGHGPRADAGLNRN